VDNASAQRLCSAIPEDTLSLADSAARHAAATADTSAAIACPVCSSPLRRTPIVAARVDIDLCDQHGTWFDRGELRQIAWALKNGRPRGLAPAAVAAVGVGVAAAAVAASPQLQQTSTSTALDVIRAGVDVLDVGASVVDLGGAVAEGGAALVEGAGALTEGAGALSEVLGGAAELAGGVFELIGGIVSVLG
jgi:hypothetical protein